mmetsp:Transcript_18210/g.28349  ORF Transcript_18210/g.28349 Transcript_18210/m.28349 type:complete len:746 (-) Transcript_18210:599-2836(-)
MNMHVDLNPRSPSKSDLKLEVANLREKLKRRNTILDTIRKAYHRDIITVKECLYRIQRDENENVCNSISKKIMANLESLPSLDIRRNINLRLFAPDDCDLRLNNCYSCGGSLDIVHKENKRVKKLEMLLEDTLLQANDAKETLEETSVKLKALEDQSKHEIAALEERIKQLLNQMTDYRILKKEVSFKDEALSLLNARLGDFESTKQDLERSERMLSGLQMMREEMQQRICRLALDGRSLLQERSVLKSQVTALRADQSSRIEDAKQLMVDFVSTKDDLRRTSADLVKSLTETERLRSELTESRKEVADLKISISSTELRHGRTVTKMQQCQDGLEYELKNLRLEILAKSEELEKTSAELERLNLAERTSIAQREKQEKEEQLELEATASARELEMQREIMREAHRQFLLMLEVSDQFHSSLMTRLRQCGVAVDKNKESWKKSPAFEIMEKMRCTDQHKVWNSLASFETDQKNVVINCLRKRFDDALNCMCNHMNGLEQHHEQNLLAQKSEADALITEARHRSSEKVSILNKAINDMKDKVEKHETAYNRLSKSYEALKKESGILRGKFSDLQIEYVKKQDTIAELADNASAYKAQLHNCDCRLSETSQELSDANVQIEEKTRSIAERDIQIEALSHEIKRVTCVYHNLVEAEQKRLDSNIDLGIQITPVVKDISVSADFVVPAASLRSTDLLRADTLMKNDIPVVFRPSTRSASRSSLNREIPPRSASSLRTKEFLIESLYEGR